jgi:hypothetical protein
MKIDEQLKRNLITDVENIVSTELRPQTKKALMRCFEITVGNYLASINSEIEKAPEDKPTDEMIEKYYECHANSKCYMEGAKAMRDNKIPISPKSKS